MNDPILCLMTLQSIDLGDYRYGTTTETLILKQKHGNPIDALAQLLIMETHPETKEETIKKGKFENFREPDYKLILGIQVE